ncbi:MAG: hypothetical protein K0S12_1672 [Bacteroidetes bacterium]|nr:hypothetical protein [Bacteroidota bacterium]
MIGGYIRHLAISVCFYLIIATSLVAYLIFTNSDSLKEINLLRFDAILYQDIKNNGYHADWLCAFFPAFPYLWKILACTPVSIALLNGVLFILSISLLATIFKMNWKLQLLTLSIPSFIFMFVPYTESLFFVCCTVFIFGLVKKQSGPFLIGLFLASLVRPTTFVFVPAILGSYFLYQADIKTAFRKSLMPVAILILGLFTTIVIHYLASGKWFVFFEAQKLWKNYLHMPQLPLTSWGGDGIVRLDGSALFISLVCGLFAIFSYIKKSRSGLTIPPDLGFSALYTFGTALLILAYRDGNLYSLNRFIYATPFCVVLLSHFFSGYQFKWKHVWMLIIASQAFWLLFGSYNHIQNLMLFTCITVYFVLLMLSRHPNKILSGLSLCILIIGNCVGMIYLYKRYIHGEWIA